MTDAPIIGFWDTETFCEIPLRNGTAAYAKEAEIMLHQWAIGDGPVKVWDATAGGEMPEELRWMLAQADILVVQNSFFDRTVGRHNGIHIDPARIHDTMVQALSHGLPGGLDKLCDIFKVPVDKAKDKRGKQLVQLFCKPRPVNSKLRRATKHTHPVEWKIFAEEYAPSDIESMRVLYKRMPRWNYPAPREHALWVLDQQINDRGIKADLDLARAAIDTVAHEKKAEDKRTQEITFDQIRSMNQRDEALKFLLSEYGVELPDMQKGTLERRLEDEDLPDLARELIAIRLQTATTSNSKYNALLKAVSSDGRLRGMLQFSGAAKTKRWAGRVVQVKNLPRPDMEAWDIELGIDMMKAGAAHLLYDEPTKLASNALRGFIVADEGKKLVVSDLSQVQARILPWLAGEEWKLRDFRAYDTIVGHDLFGKPIRGGPDLYDATAGRLLGKHPEAITSAERQAYGKVITLSTGFGGSVGAFAQFARLYHVDLPEHEVYQIVRAWRELHPALCDWDTGFWKKLDDAARQAIRAPGKTFAAGEHIRFERWREWLRMELPSGGFLSYAAPAIVQDPKRPENTAVSYRGVNPYTKQWQRLYTYGGKLSADATQATERELVAHNLQPIEDEGFSLILISDDEVVTEPPDDPAYSVERLNALLAANPPWAKGLPLAAGGFESTRYRKGE